MNEQLAIYLWSISESIRVTLTFGPVICLALCVAIVPPILDYDWDKIISFGKKLVTVAIICIICGILIPSKQDLALIFLYPKVKQGTIEMVQSDTAKKMKTVLDSYLDKQIKELQQ